jgi:hypothetical protein
MPKPRNRIVEKAIAPRHHARSEPRIVVSQHICHFCAERNVFVAATTYFQGRGACDEHERLLQLEAIEAVSSHKTGWSITDGDEE